MKKQFSFVPVKVVLNYTCPYKINSKLYLPGKWDFFKTFRKKKKKEINKKYKWRVMTNHTIKYNTYMWVIAISSLENTA